MYEKFKKNTVFWVQNNEYFCKNAKNLFLTKYRISAENRTSQLRCEFLHDTKERDGKNVRSRCPGPTKSGVDFTIDYELEVGVVFF